MKIKLLTEESDIDGVILRMIYNSIVGGSSKISEAVRSGKLSLKDIAEAISSSRCLRLKHYDVGSTYLEQIVGRIINNVIPIEHINRARQMFGLSILGVEAIRDIAKKRQQQQS